MYRFLLAIVPLLFMAAQPVEARKRDENQPGQKCQQPKKKRSGGLLGSIAGGIAGSALGRTGLPSGVIGLAVPVSSLITDVIARKLNCKEQVQAATATTEATRGGVGTTSAWTSDTRPGVQGRSTVVAQNAAANGGSCMTVTDVVIVDGEETTVDKRMCRSPGGGNYVVTV
jgi:hypothetical protein